MPIHLVQLAPLVGTVCTGAKFIQTTKYWPIMFERHFFLNGNYAQMDPFKGNLFQSINQSNNQVEVIGKFTTKQADFNHIEWH